MDFSLLFCVLGLAFILEGLPYFLFAEKMPSVLKMLMEQPPSSLRKIGVGAILIGLLLVYFGRSI